MSEKSEREHESTQETEGKIDLFEFFSDFLRGFRRIWWLIPALVCLGGGLTFGRAVRQYRPMYQSQASFTVTTAAASQDGYSYSFYYDSSTVKQMAATFPYILESNLLTDLVKSDLGVGCDQRYDYGQRGGRLQPVYADGHQQQPAGRL